MNRQLLAQLLGDVFHESETTSLYTNIPDIELSHDWQNFEEILGRYKKVYKDTLFQLRNVENDLTNIVNDLSILENSVSAILDPLMQSEISTMIERYKQEHEYTAKKQKASELAGTVRAMEKVLLNTGAKRYQQFTCSVCMERLVDTFLDPCGHLMCEQCLVRTQRAQCPMCRSNIVPKRIYTTM